MTVSADALVATPANVSDRDAGVDLDAVPHRLGRAGRDRRDRRAAIGWSCRRHRARSASHRSSSAGPAAPESSRPRPRRPRSRPSAASRPMRSSIPAPSRTSSACRRSPGTGARVVFDPIYGPIVNDHIKAACREAIVFVYGALDATPLELGLGGMLRKQIRLQGYTLGPLARRSGAARPCPARSPRCSSAATSRRSSIRISRSSASRTRIATSSRIGRSARSSSRRRPVP